MPMLPPLDWHAFLVSWQVRPVWDALALVTLVAYVVGLRRAQAAGTRAVHPVRVGSFVAGLALLVWTLSSALEVYATTLFWVHMVQHLLLIMVVPALLVLGHPLTVLVAATRGRTRSVVERVLVTGPVAVLTHPLVGLGYYSTVIVATHLTSFMDQMMSSPWLGPAEQALYLSSGYLLLLPLLGNEPIRWKPPQLFRIGLFLIAMTPDTVVGIVLMQTDHDLFPGMLGNRPSWAPSAVSDINTGGALMWVGGDGLMMVFAVSLVIAIIAAPDREDLIGSWLEGVRRSSMSDHVGEGAGRQGFGDDDDVDDSDEALAAYNRMLGRLDGHR
ncbi:MAG: cytochrome c oxidase assembly protein [Nocardioidaceae bacterium]